MKRLVRWIAGLALVLSAGSAPAVFAEGKAIVADTSFQGLWWKGESESGWGANLTHQGNVIFMTWFTYGPDGNGMWLAGLFTRNGTTSTYTGTLNSIQAASFRASPWLGSTKVVTPVGAGTLTFTDTDTGTFSYTYRYTTEEQMYDGYYYYTTIMTHDVAQTKSIQREILAAGAPTCTLSGTRSAPFNYTDLWWNPEEDGWGINFTHHGNVIFATWFTYDDGGRPMWLAGVLSPTATAGQFAGDPLLSTRGAPLFNEPWDPAMRSSQRVGTIGLTFTDASHATFTYTVNGTTQSKAIERQIFAASPTICR